MKFRIFYTDIYEAKHNNLPKVGTIVDLETIQDFVVLSGEFGWELVYSDRNKPLFLEYGIFENNTFWYGGYDKNEIIEDNYLISSPEENWLSDQWIEIYNGHRE